MKLHFVKTKSYLGHNLGKNISIQGVDSAISAFLLGTRKESCIFNPEITNNYLIRALYILSLIFRTNGHLLIVNTNPEFSKFVKNIMEYTNKRDSISFCNSKWVGGTLTNWNQISKSIITFSKFSKRFSTFLNMNNIHFPKYKKMKKCFQGFGPSKIDKSVNRLCLLINNVDQYKEEYFVNNKHIIRKPDIIFLVNPNENQNVIDEANRLNIPIIAIIDSNSSIKGITYPIPANNNSFEFLYFCFSWIVRLLKRI